MAGHWRDHCEERRALGLSPEPAKWRAGRTLLVTETDEEARAYLRSPGNSLEWYFRYIIGLTRHGGFVHMLKSDPNMPDAEVTPRYVSTRWSSPAVREAWRSVSPLFGRRSDLSRL